MFDDFPQPHTVTIVTPAVTTDSRGDEALSYTTGATRVDVSGWMQQQGASETVGDRDERVSTWTLYSDETAGVTALDRIEWNGRTFEVNGEPNHLWTSVYDHSEISLRLAEG